MSRDFSPIAPIFSQNFLCFCPIFKLIISSYFLLENLIRKKYDTILSLVKKKHKISRHRIELIISTSFLCIFFLNPTLLITIISLCLLFPLYIINVSVLVSLRQKMNAAKVSFELH